MKSPFDYAGDEAHEAYLSGVAAGAILATVLIAGLETVAWLIWYFAF